MIRKESAGCCKLVIQIEQDAVAFGLVFNESVVTTEYQGHTSGCVASLPVLFSFGWSLTLLTPSCVHGDVKGAIAV